MQMCNPFDLLEIKPTFDLSMDQLDQHYFKKQQQFHPDRFVEADKKNEVIQQAIFCNIAYNALKNVLQRAQALLDYYNYPWQERQVDQDFLLNFFQWQEDLEQNPQGMHDKKQQLYCQLQQSFKENNFKEATFYLHQLQYLEKF